MAYLHLRDALRRLSYLNIRFGSFGIVGTFTSLVLGFIILRFSIQQSLLFALALSCAYVSGLYGASFNYPYWYLRGVRTPADMTPSERRDWIVELRGELTKFDVTFVRERSEGMSGMSEAARAAYLEEMLQRLHDAADAMSDDEKRDYGRKLARQFMWFQGGSLGWPGMGGSMPPMPPGAGEYGSGYGRRNGLPW